MDQKDLNSKNRLQEYFQKKRSPVPKYSTIKHGSGQQISWTSTVTLCDGHQYDSDTTKLYATKVSAEISAAQRALSSLTDSSELINEILNFSISKITIKTALLVDVENLPNFIDEIPKHEFYNDMITVYAFIGQHHCLIDKPYPSNTIKIVSPSTRPDGTDTCMQIYVGVLLSKEIYDNYLVATRDHYGSALVELITSPNIGWNSKSARLVTKPCHIYSY